MTVPASYKALNAPLSVRQKTSKLAKSAFKTDTALQVSRTEAVNRWDTTLLSKAMPTSNYQGHMIECPLQLLTSS